ncbi:MAG: CRISPR-associated endonuclease Cas1 [Thaumarchaeota archaeon]|nr:CRISPR-associated endonuclease Cas1 [Nitrososphaerota archaeon]
MADTKEPSRDLIPVRMLAQYAYCRRLAYMEWVQGEFAYNAEVVDGTYKHRNVDKPSKRTKPPKGGDAEGPGDVIHARSVMLSDAKLGLVAKMDLLEIDGGVATPIEYKRGTTPQTPTGTYPDHVVQVCAQGLILRANGYACTGGIIYYVGSKQRVRVDFDEQTVSMTMQMIGEMREMASRDTMPPPLVDSPKCPRCSLVGICMPDETNLLGGASTQRGITKDQVRRMYPIRDDAVPVYVQDQGARVSKSGDCIHVKTADETRKIRLIDVSELTVFGNVQITTQTIRELCGRDIPVCYMTYGGWFVGMTRGLASKNVGLRIGQHQAYSKISSRMAIAREIVSGKIKNSITMLRRNHGSPPARKIAEMEGFAQRALAARQYDALLGIEGMAARLYFSEFSGMLKSDSAAFDFEGRNRRPPKDPVNAMLSFLYAMLTRQATVTASKVGLDPYLGYLHMPKHGKPALALDLIEEFRPLVADSTCLTLVNTGEISESDVVQSDFGVALTAEGRRTVIRAYERRMDASVMHPLLGYGASYRRILETQARLLSRHILGEIAAYPAFRTR